MMSNKEKKRRQHEKELKSLRNKMGPNIVWFDSLSKTKQYDILFEWKRKKQTKKNIKPEYVEVWKREPIDPKRPWGKTKRVKSLELVYPPSLKHFIISCKHDYRFTPKVQKLREATIDLLLKN